jgi:hypothetical protein
LSDYQFFFSFQLLCLEVLPKALCFFKKSYLAWFYTLRWRMYVRCMLIHCTVVWFQSKLVH